MADINLLQNQIKDTTHVATKRTKIVVWVSLLLLLATAGVGVGLYFMTQGITAKTVELTETNDRLRENVTDQQQQLSDAQIYQAKLVNIESLLDSHVNISPLLEEFEKQIYQRALFSSLDIAQDTGKIHIEGVVDSYNGLGKLLLGLSTSSHFRDVKLLSVGFSDAAGYIFSIDLFANSDIFINKD